MHRPAALLAYSPSLNPDTFTVPQRAQLEAMVDLLRETPADDLSDPAVAALLPRVEIIVTGWGVQPITIDVLEQRRGASSRISAGRSRRYAA